MKWGELNVKGIGTAALDDSLQPRVEGVLRLEGYAAALDAIGGAGLLPGGALAARAVLELMARRQPDGTETVEVPLRLQGGMVRAGQVPMLRLPPLNWMAP